MTDAPSRRVGRAVAGVVLPCALVVLWHFSVKLAWVPNTLIAAPYDVLIDGQRMLFSGELLGHARMSLQRVLLGFVIGAASGILIGTLVGASRIFEDLLNPTLRALAPVPPTAWIPLLIITLGIDEESKIGLIALGTFMVLYAATLQGIRGTERAYVEVAAVFEKSRAALVRSVLLPAAAPSIFTGVRVALGLSWILLVASELVSAPLTAAARTEGIGLGWLIYDARRFSRTDDVIVGMIAIAVVGAATDVAAGYLQARVLRWRRVFQGA